MSDKNASTMGIEKASNWCLQKMSEDNFVKTLLEDQPFVPKYFTYDVELNKKGADNFSENIRKVKISEQIPYQLKNYLVIDTRNESEFKKGFLKNSVNLMGDTKFETWLGSIIAPFERFYLLAKNKDQLQPLIERIAKIGYEGQIELAFVASEIDGGKMKN